MAESLASLPTLDAVADGQALDNLPPSAVAALYERASVAEARLRAWLLVAPNPVPPRSEPDRVLGIDEAATTLAMTRDFLYRHWERLALGFKDADGHVKFSQRVLQRYIQQRSGGRRAPT